MLATRIVGGMPCDKVAYLVTRFFEALLLVDEDFALLVHALEESVVICA